MASRCEISNSCSIERFPDSLSSVCVALSLASISAECSRLAPRRYSRTCTYWRRPFERWSFRWAPCRLATAGLPPNELGERLISIGMGSCCFTLVSTVVRSVLSLFKSVSIKSCLDLSVGTNSCVSRLASWKNTRRVELAEHFWFSWSSLGERASLPIKLVDYWLETARFFFSRRERLN